MDKSYSSEDDLEVPPNSHGGLCKVMVDFNDSYNFILTSYNLHINFI